MNDATTEAKKESRVEHAFQGSRIPFSLKTMLRWVKKLQIFMLLNTPEKHRDISLVIDNQYFSVW